MPRPHASENQPESESDRRDTEKGSFPYIRQASQLVRILPELEGPSYDAYFVYPEEFCHSKRIAVFRDYLICKIAESHFFRPRRQAGNRTARRAGKEPLCVH